VAEIKISFKNGSSLVRREVCDEFREEVYNILVGIANDLAALKGAATNNGDEFQANASNLVLETTVE